MICSACGKENADGNWVCSGCGEPLAITGQSTPAHEPPSYDYDSPSYGSYSDEERSGSAAGASSKGSNTFITVLAIGVLVVLAAASAWYMFMRSPTDLNTPGGTMEAYIKAVSDGDCDKIYDMTPSDMVPANRDQAARACSLFAGLLDIEYKDYETIEETVDGDTATVTFQVTIEAAGQSVPDEMTMDLVKENGQWKVEPLPPDLAGL